MQPASPGYDSSNPNLLQEMYEQIQRLTVSNAAFQQHFDSGSPGPSNSSYNAPPASSSAPNEARFERLPTPKGFDGSDKSRDALGNFKNDLTTYFWASRMTDQTYKLSYAVALLSGSAKTCWCSHCERTETSFGVPGPTTCTSFEKLCIYIITPEFQNTNYLRLAQQRREIAQAEDLGPQGGDRLQEIQIDNVRYRRNKEARSQLTHMSSCGTSHNLVAESYYVIYSDNFFKFDRHLSCLTFLSDNRGLRYEVLLGAGGRLKGKHQLSPD